MAKNELSPIELANQDIPERWYELSYRENQLLTAGSALSLLFLNYFVFHLDSPPIHALGATTFALSVLADRYSTVLALRANTQAEKMGFQTGLAEQNPLVPNVMTPREFLLNKRAAAWDIANIAFSGIFPFAGIGLAIGRIECTVSNLRNTARINRAIEIAAIQKGQ